MSDIPVIDYVFAALVLLMVIHGYIKGFVEELFSWAAIVLAVWAAVLLNSAGAAFIRERFMQNVRVVPEILSFIAVFLLVIIVVKLLGRVLKDVIAGANLGTLNRILGALFGLIEGFALTLLVIFVLTVQPVFNASGLLAPSIFAQFLLSIIKIPVKSEPDVLNSVLYLLPEIPA